MPETEEIISNETPTVEPGPVEDPPAQPVEDVEAIKSDYQKLLLENKKRDALEKTISELGDDFSIGKDEKAKLLKTISLLSDSDELENTIKDLVDVAKRVVSKPKMSITFGPGIDPRKPTPGRDIRPKNMLINFYKKG